jgi:hypothetical protein
MWPPRHRLTFRFTCRGATDQTFDGVGRRDRVTEAIGQAQRENGEGFVEAFPDVCRGTWKPVLQASREIL